MGNKILDFFVNVISSIHIPFTGATWFVISTLTFFCWLFARASRDGSNGVHWEHLIMDSQNNRASPYKVGYLVGIIVSTWIVIRMSDTGNLSLDIFGAYLTFLLGGAGINTYVKAKTTFGSLSVDTSQSSDNSSNNSSNNSANN